MMKKVRVLHLIRTLERGGAERVVANYAKYHDRTRFEVSVCCLVDRGEIADEVEAYGVKVDCLNKKGRNPNVIIRLCKLLNRERIDILHAHNVSAAFWGVLAAKLAGIPTLIITEHNVVTNRSWYSKTLAKMLGASVNSLIAVSEGVRLSHLREYGLSPRKVITIRNGIDIEHFNGKDQPAPKELLADMGIEDNCFIVGNVGSLTEQKNQACFIDMAQLVLETVPNTHFIIIGEGALRPNLETQIRRLGLENRVHLLGKRPDVKDLLRAMDIFVLSSLWEGLPISILEAMASGIPIIATDVGGNSEAIKGGISGILVPPGNASTIAEAVTRLLHDKSFSESLAKRAFESLTENFSAATMVRTTEALYLDFINEEPSISHGQNRKTKKSRTLIKRD
jgi:glycosyltransferase involved in cell wall biosynthesis